MHIPLSLHATATQAFDDGVRLRSAGQLNEALQCFEHAIMLDPSHVESWERAGGVHLLLGDAAQSVTRLERALVLDASRPNARYNLGLAYRQLKRLVEAQATFEQFVAEHPQDAEAHNNLGCVRAEQQQHAQAVVCFKRALALNPRLAEAAINLATSALALHQPGRAVATLEPLGAQAPGLLLQAYHHACSWSKVAPLEQHIDQALHAGQPAIEPFAYQGYATDPHLQRLCAQLHQPPPPAPTHQPPAPARSVQRLRIGYVAGEFRQQATSTLLVRTLEHHDRARFDVFAFDNGWDDGSALRQRVVRAVDQLVPIQGLNDEQAAAAIAAAHIDLLVDLNGFFGLARPGVFRLRPAPVQVNFLGFPGTLASGVHDYLVADHVVVPAAERAHYSECLAYLPDSYQPSDAPLTPQQLPPTTRAQHHLPDDAVVLACFNNNYKIRPEVFAVWLRTLGAVPHAVLWLLADNADARANLQAVAQQAGLAPTRLIFAPRIEPAEHLARLALADLFVDTTPCNAHTTANDALRVGVPVLTCTGRTFSSRVAASLLHAVGLPELVTHNLAAYEQLALALVRDGARLRQLRQQLTQRSAVAPLFDAPRHTRHLESAYLLMWQQHLSGQAPRDFSVPSQADWQRTG